MKSTELIMGMPITVEIVDKMNAGFISVVFDYFKSIDERYSTYKPTSEISQINKGLPKDRWSIEMKQVLDLCEQTRVATNGYFNIEKDGVLDPSGLVKGWAIYQASQLLTKHGIKNFYIEAGGDIQVHGRSEQHRPWTIGIRNPFNEAEVIKTLVVKTEGVATSGSYIRGQHIYNPLKPDTPILAVKSLTVIGPNVYEADRLATAAFAMGQAGIDFIESISGLEAYMVDASKTATYTSGFERFVTDV